MRRASYRPQVTCSNCIYGIKTGGWGDDVEIFCNIDRIRGLLIPNDSPMDPDERTPAQKTKWDAFAKENQVDFCYICEFYSPFPKYEQANT
jgi:hypothetical protein